MSATESQTAKIVEIAGRLGTSPDWLDALIRFETGGTYSPSVKNPSSSARGLIQIIDSTARNLFGMDSAALVAKYNTFDSQMDNVVYPYLKQYMPFGTQQSLYMAVFYPAFRYVPPDTAFPDSIRKVNPGIDTVADYVNRANGIKVSSVSKIAPLPLLLAAGAAIWYLTRKKLIHF